MLTQSYLTVPYDPDWAGLDFDDLEQADAAAVAAAYWAEVEAGSSST